MKMLTRMVFAVAMGVLAVACGGGTSSRAGGAGGGSQTCQTQHSCINGACTCETSGKSGTSCTDDAKCDAECQVCK